MDHYLDIQTRPDPEFPTNTVLGALVSKLHRGLVTLDADDIGISFPKHEEQPPLGTRLRLHGTRERLDTLMDQDWLKGMRDHVTVCHIEAIPDEARYRVVRRRQYKTNVERLRRRRMKRHGESYEEACQHIPDRVERRVKTPFVMVRSQSTRQAFSLFIEHGEVRREPTLGRFNTYGLSNEATVPWF